MSEDTPKNDTRSGSQDVDKTGPGGGAGGGAGSGGGAGPGGGPGGGADAGPDAKAQNFLRELVKADLDSGRHQTVATRFPPEPNGYLHIGHAKSILLNFGLAEEFGGTCNVRFDDTNPTAEDTEYVEAILEDVRWLGCDWGDRLYYASDYFGKLHEMALDLIREGKAYVDSLTPDEIREHRGDYNRPGRPSPYRDRSVEENLALFAKMKAGELKEGEAVLRAKGDLAAANMNLRDPLLYRIRFAHHHRTGDDWCIYPMYDWAHGQSDAIEHITHSICTLEFENHRPLYDWFLDQIDLEKHGMKRSRQYEFARLNLTYTVMSKRRLLHLVREGLVDGWDDPRMPTLCGLRRRGVTPAALKAFCERIGVSRRDGVVDVTLLEHAVRDDLNRSSPRVMGVLRPLKVIIENLPEGEVIELDAPLDPENPAAGSRKVPFTRELWVEQDDFREEAPRKWFRLAPGKEVRLRYAALVTCQGFEKDPATGAVTELRCTWDPQSLGGTSPDGRKVKGTIHWVSASHAVEAEARLYDRLFTVENPLDVPEGEDWTATLNPGSLEMIEGCKLEPFLGLAAPGSRWQLERVGYFCVDTKDTVPGRRMVLNRTLALKDSWARIERREGE
ncbi:MAG: glutamine--tRNA ligase/YqeY domain fusion protein [Polyangia bacterium]|jgi:glutaminyl-tRNA synthetase|nr:glutamine--tRNA ligase/YqeY domain fusion protein [Polyangia bacterium]